MSVNKETFLAQLSDEEKKKWKQSHNQTVKESIHEYIIKHVGDPLTELIRYLEEDHLRHCVPANVSSGFISRPVAFVYTDGKANRSQPTTGRLPTGELLNGKKSYDYFLSFFLSTNMTAAEVHRIGRQQIDKIYPEIIELAKNVTKESNDNQALEKFKKLVSSRDTYFNSEPFPANESDKNAQEKCTSNEKAAQFCPQRWKSMQKWFSMAKEVMSTILPKTIKFFYFTGQNSSVPACPLELQVDFNPSSAAPSYLSSSHDCIWTCKYNIPFFLDNMGPKYTETTTSSHEASPGHHTQVQGAMENFADRCGGLIGWLNSNVQSYALSEGWGLYSESPLIAEETDSYQNEPLQKYGMLKMQMWRAIRMVVDTGLHSMGMTRDEALDLFTKYAWDSTDMAFKEVSRYQSSPGQATCYMVGQLEIQRLRKFAEEKLGNKFDLKEFHYHLLSQDSAPLFYMESHIQFFVACKLQEYKPEGCSQLFQDKNVAGKTQRSMNVRQQWPHRQVIHRYW